MHGQDIYKSIEEKGANFLYLIVKNHVFADGNKRIAATLFIYFLNFYGITTATLTGGEPLVRKDIIDIANELKKEFCNVTITTNGSLLGKCMHIGNYIKCINIINKLRFNEESSLFAVERDKGLESIIGNIYQSFARTRYLQEYRRKRSKFLIFNSKKSCICRWQ